MASARARERDAWRRLFTRSAAALLPMMLLHYSHHDTDNLATMTLMLVLATAVQIGTGRRFYRAAYQGWTHGRTLGMDFLIVLGTTASYAYSVIIYLLHVFTPYEAHLQPTFLTGVMLLTFVSMGKWLEAIAKGNTCSAIQSLMEMQPTTAARITNMPSTDKNKNNDDMLDLAALKTETVSTTDIVPNDYVKVLPGERLPADGILVSISTSATPSTTNNPHTFKRSNTPQAFLDESSFSGEPFPVSKQMGDEVSGGTVNTSSAVLVVRVTAAGRDSLLAKIVQLVEDAQRHKAPIQLYADRVASVFAPVVMVLAGVTLVFWLIVDGSDSNLWQERVFVALMSSISVVVVACPCALGLGTSCRCELVNGTVRF